MPRPEQPFVAHEFAASGELVRFSGTPIDAAILQIRRSKVCADFAKVLRAEGRNVAADLELRQADRLIADSARWEETAKNLARFTRPGREER